MDPKERLIVALDYPQLSDADRLVSELGESVGSYKVGLELASASSWSEAINFVQARGGQVFADAKLKDIPNTIAKAARNITAHKPSMLNMYADSGVETMQVAMEEVKKTGTVKMLGVTVLTSMSPEECERIYGVEPRRAVLRLGRMAIEGGLDGVICSPQELEILNSDPDTAKLLKVTPGVRPKWTQANDQKRVMTPRQAVEAGADYLVIGRPITSPPESIGTPAAAVEAITQEMGKA